MFVLELIDKLNKHRDIIKLIQMEKLFNATSIILSKILPSLDLNWSWSIRITIIGNLLSDI